MSHLVFVDSGGWIGWLACFVLTCLFVWFYVQRVLSIGKGKRGFVRREVAHTLYATDFVPKNTRKPDWVRNELIRLAALMSQQSRRAVGRTFNRLYAQKYGVSVGSSFTCDFLKAHAVQVLRLRRELKARPPRIVPICHTWALDLTFFTDDAKVTHASLGIIDHGSRALLCLQTLVKRNSWTLLGHLCIAIGRYGKPHKLRSENERSEVSVETNCA